MVGFLFLCQEKNITKRLTGVSKCAARLAVLLQRQLRKARPCNQGIVSFT
jgi:hypothetical protein